MPPVDVELVKQRNPIERVIASHGVRLQQRGELETFGLRLQDWRAALALCLDKQ